MIRGMPHKVKLRRYLWGTYNAPRNADNRQSSSRHLKTPAHFINRRASGESTQWHGRSGWNPTRVQHVGLTERFRASLRTAMNSAPCARRCKWIAEATSDCSRKMVSAEAAFALSACATESCMDESLALRAAFSRASWACTCARSVS
jgi:hypothetical protein